eukprot:CAMPEP_0167778752 /NCGR_PEP_ID=MMETSP0111_2-20121227/4429_1 /TAXON_ID=91324 /ORGANISM="Lotharella globosa, Strain CCCM811" /LENGTH=220 /DNA_ID=CAMNT_0007669093 /DNA_START=118 /DNA_END=780 /DNA_ORIENTATION=+
MIKLCTKTGRAEFVAKFIDKAKATGAIDESLYAATVNAYAVMGDYYTATRLYREITSVLGRPSAKAIVGMIWRAYVETHFSPNAKQGRTMEDPSSLLNVVKILVDEFIQEKQFPGLKALWWLVMAFEAEGRSKEAEEFIIQAGKCKISKMPNDGKRGAPNPQPGDRVSINDKNVFHFREMKDKERLKYYAELLSKHLDFHIVFDPPRRSQERAARWRREN